ncbi:hypothetical protein RCS94_04100 [Orbaceae bacterium ac157xtp]
MLIAPSSYGALSATSANTIQGSRPGFTGQSGAKKLGFKVDGTTYSESLNNINPNITKEFNAGLKLSDFTVTSLTASDFSPTADYADADGDLAHPTTPFSMSPRTYVWKDRNGTTITNYNQTLGCGSGLNLPLTLRITLPNVKVKSRYGNPSESLSTELVQEYKIGTATGICFAKPNQMNYYNGATPNPTEGGGYTSDFDPSNGFKVSANPKFPTTGFPKASFTLIMTSNANDYTFSSNSSAVTVDTTGKVTLNSKPSGAVTIKAIFKNDTNQVHYYTFNPTTVWVRPTGTSSYGNYAWAKTQCGGSESNIPSRAQLTNSPQKNAPQGWSYFANYYTRAVGGGVFGEWGYTSSGTYPGSQWTSSYGYYWTRDAWSASRQFLVRSYDGNVRYDYTGRSYYVACLE